MIAVLGMIFLAAMGAFFYVVCKNPEDLGLSESTYLIVLFSIPASIIGGGILIALANVVHVFGGGKEDLKIHSSLLASTSWIAVRCFVLTLILWPIATFGGVAIIPILFAFILWKTLKGAVKIETKKTVRESSQTVTIKETSRSVRNRSDAAKALHNLGFNKRSAKDLTDGLEGTSEDIIKDALSKSRRPLPD